MSHTIGLHAETKKLELANVWYRIKNAHLPHSGLIVGNPESLHNEVLSMLENGVEPQNIVIEVHTSKTQRY